MVSILIPTYNFLVVDLVTKLHEQCEELSLSFEIIVIDDHSPNASIIDKNSAISNLNYCNFLRNDKNLGRAATRDLLAKEAQYNWLLFLDADVIPSSNNFIKFYIDTLEDKVDLICGGIEYSKEEPAKEQLLRYRYGLKREVRSVASRNQDKYTVVSANLLIRKSIFLAINNQLENFYGDDLVLSQNLKRAQPSIRHINNPVIHLGLENSTIFIQKSLESIEMTVHFEENNLFENDLRPIQRAYLKLKKYGMLGLMSFFIEKFKSQIEKNLHSSKPSLLLFDLYRLNHYIKLKKNG